MIFGLWHGGILVAADMRPLAVVKATYWEADACIGDWSALTLFG